MLENPIDPGRLQEIYSRTAAFYDDVVAEHQAAAKELAIETLNRRTGESFLEVGFGTAWALVRIIRESGAERVFGVEAALGMIDVARTRLRSEGAGQPELVLGDLRGLPFADQEFDCLLCTYTLEVLPEPVIYQALAEMRRVLRAGGRLVIVDLTEGEGGDAAMIENWKQRYARGPEFFGGARPLRLLPLLEASGFYQAERRYSGHGAGWPSEVVLAAKQT